MSNRGGQKPNANGVLRASRPLSLRGTPTTYYLVCCLASQGFVGKTRSKIVAHGKQQRAPLAHGDVFSEGNDARAAIADDSTRCPCSVVLGNDVVDVPAIRDTERATKQGATTEGVVILFCCAVA